MVAGSRTKTSEFRQNGLAAIKTVINLYNVHKWDAGQLQKFFEDAVDQLETALAVGKVMQDMLLEHMTAQELNRRMLAVRTTVSDRAENDGQMSLFEKEGNQDGTSGTAAGIQKPQT